jgi:hypothetical protein
VITPVPGLVGRLWMDRSLGEIWEIDVRAATVGRVPIPSGIFPIQPSVPLSGEPLSFAGAVPDAGERYAIYVNDRPVLPVQGDISYEDPAWSADGRTLYVTRVGIPQGSTGGAATAPKSGLAIQVVPNASQLATSHVPVTASTLIDDGFQPAPSYDGAWLAYTSVDVSNPVSPTKGIRIRNLKSSEDHSLVPPDHFYDVYGPRWMPNNQQVIFSAADASLFTSGARQSPSLLLALVDLVLAPHPALAHSWIGDIWRVNSDGSALTRLTTSKFKAPIAAPSPDGSQIAVVSGEGLFIMNADGSGLIKISEDGSNGNITWSH